MPEPVLASVALGVAGNLASNIVTAAGQSFDETAAGRALSSLGLLKPGFEQRLQRALDDAAMRFLDDNPDYKIPEIFHFLNSKPLARDLKEMLVEQKGLDASKIVKRLEGHIGKPISEAPHNWPNNIDPVAFTQRLFDCFVEQLGLSADNGIVWLSVSIAEHGLLLKGISRKLDKVLAGQTGDVTSKFSEIHADFQTKYISHIAGRAQRISTPGARELRGINQSLSVAYISLNLKSGAAAEAVRAEEFLSSNRHVTIRGPAGSGKTTLLNWLVTKCDLANPDIDEKWQGYVPFIVPLRKVARLHQGPPTLERLLEYSVDNKLWATPVPTGWIEEVVQSQQRAIMMIDGVDELPPSRRLEFWEWIESFTDEYPENRVIITSRVLPGTSGDSVITDQWNPPRQFVDSQLQDMSDADVTSFVHHWHDSIDSTKLDIEELSSLADARAALPTKLEDVANRRIRELCNTPLLCAMICVLHWKEEGYLPRYRVEVYERCCDMLIEARDHKRGVNPPPGPIAAMSKSDKEMVLQQLAIEMMRNRDDSDVAADDTYRIEIAKDRALEWIAPRIQRFQSPAAREATPIQVLNYLVERTGLLREPATDLIDFPHRTFQEYLAACAAGAESQESMLARQVEDDQWHETIMLAAGTSTGGISFGKRLIEKLITRGENHQSPREKSLRIRKTCFALALGCLENLRQQDEALRESVLSHLGELVPPRSDDDARILSVAGDAAVAHLPYGKWKDESTTTVSACARALRLIGTTEAIRSMQRDYAADTREGVLTEVCKAAAFPLAHIPSVVSKVTASGVLPRFVEVVDLSLLDGLQGIRELDFDVAESRNHDHIKNLSELNSVSVTGVSASSDFLFNLPPSLRRVTLHGRNLPLGNWISRLPDLQEMLLILVSETDCRRILENSKQLKELGFMGSDLSQIDLVNRLHELSYLRLANLGNLKSVASLAHHESLSRLEIDDCANLHEMDLGIGFSKIKVLEIDQPQGNFKIYGYLAEGSQLEKFAARNIDIYSLQQFNFCRNLKSLQISNCKIDSLDELADFYSLEQIDLSHLELRSLIVLPDSVKSASLTGLSSVTNETFREGLTDLLELEIERCLHIENLDFLRQSPLLNRLVVSSLPRLQNLSGIVGCPVTSLTIMNCDAIDDLSAISSMAIDRLSLVSLDSLSDLTPLRKMKALRHIDLANSEQIVDLSFALDLPELETIRLSGMNTALQVPEPLRPKILYGPPMRAMYFRHRNGWRRDDWHYADYRRALSMQQARWSRRAVNAHMQNGSFWL